MLTKELDRETEQLLAEILEQENTTSDELIRTMIRDRWLSLNKSSVEQSIGLSIDLDRSVQPDLAQPDLAQPDGKDGAHLQTRQKNSKQTIAEFIRRKRYR